MSDKRPARKRVTRRAGRIEEKEQEELQEVPGEGSSSWSDIGDESEPLRQQAPDQGLPSAVSGDEAEAIADDDQEEEDEYTDEEEIDLDPEPSSSESEEEEQNEMDPDDEVKTPSGEILKLVKKPNEEVVTEKALFPKQERSKLSEDKKNDLLAKMCRRILDKDRLFALDVLDWTNEEVLTETADLETQLDDVHNHLKKYDCLDVFMIVHHDGPDAPNNINGWYDIFENYPDLTADNVAQSCKWYQQYIDHKAQPWILENLQASAEFLKANCSDTLWNAVYDEYKEHPPQEQGGPLLLYYILATVQQNNDTVLKNVVTRIENLKMTDIRGEDVGKIVRLIKSAMRRLTKASKYKTSTGEVIYKHIPDTFDKTIVKLFQSTSTPDFNDVFKSMETDALKDEHSTDVISGGHALSRTQMLTTALNLHATMVSTGTWLGIDQKGQHSVFIMGRSCWNCGGTGHLARDCPLEHNEARISKNRAESKPQRRQDNRGGRGGRGGRGDGGGGRGGGGQAGGGGGGGKQPNVPKTGKWAPPSKGEHNKRWINHNHTTQRYWWNKETSFWKVDKDQTGPPYYDGQAQVSAQGAPGPAASIAADSQGTQQSTTTMSSGASTAQQSANVATDSVKAAARAANLAAAERTFEASMRGLLDAVRDNS